MPPATANWYSASRAAYTPLSRVNADDVIESAMSNIDWSSGTPDFYREMAANDLGLDPDEPGAEEKIEAEMRRLVRQELTQKYRERFAAMEDWSRRFYAWRAITVTAGSTVEETIANIKLDGVGIYWSYDQRAAACHWGSFGEGQVEVTLAARLTPAMVNWPETLAVQIDPVTGDDEKEVRLRPGVPLMISAVTVCKRLRGGMGTTVPVRLRATA